jgi:hypothetical protein
MLIVQYGIKDEACGPKKVEMCLRMVVVEGREEEDGLGREVR